VSEGAPAHSPARDIDIERLLAQLGRFESAEEPAIPSWVAHELTFGQLRLLLLLHAGGPLTMSQVAERLSIGLPAASGVVERIERHGLMERRHRIDDRRIVECALTDEGRRLVDDLLGLRSEAVRRLLRVLSSAELAQLEQILQAVIDRTIGKP
jgi:MarR family transcriptional regulator, organic hydroperoxide resistance regulator